MRIPHQIPGVEREITPLSHDCGSIEPQILFPWSRAWKTVKDAAAPVVSFVDSLL